tara:strand:+ start:4069 stop:4539 length:471 start_codon:yes stop_codon:yes gene_type:complete
MPDKTDRNPDGTTSIKIVKIMNGADIVCVIPATVDQQKSPLLTLDKPLEIKYVPQITNIGVKDYIALVKWAAYTNDQLVTIPKDKILTITNASEEMIKSYKQVIHDYTNHDKVMRREDNPRTERLMDREMMRQDELDEYEEIFEAFNDVKKKSTIH